MNNDLMTAKQCLAIMDDMSLKRAACTPKVGSGSGKLYTELDCKCSWALKNIVPCLWYETSHEFSL